MEEVERGILGGSLDNLMGDTNKDLGQGETPLRLSIKYAKCALGKDATPHHPNPQSPSNP